MPGRAQLWLQCSDYSQHACQKSSSSRHIIKNDTEPLQVFAGLVTRDHLLVLLRQALSQPHAAGRPAEVPYEALRRNPLADRQRAAALDPLLHISQVASSHVLQAAPGWIIYHKEDVMYQQHVLQPSWAWMLQHRNLLA